MTGGEEEEDGEDDLAEASAVGASSLSPRVRLCGSEGVGFGVRARPAQASVMATLKASSIWLIEVNHDIGSGGMACLCFRRQGNGEPLSRRLRPQLLLCEARFFGALHSFVCLALRKEMARA